MSAMTIEQAAQSHAAAEQRAFQMPQILCCMCGVKIESNPVNMCTNCLKSQVDITAGISKQVAIPFCRGCGRYQKPPWMNVELESREMLALCLSRIRGLNKDVKLIDAGFIWTEPHSRRIKVKLKVEKEVLNGAIVQQTFVVDFVVTNQQCLDCQKSYTENTWTACVQVRQKVKHKRSMMYLEQMLLKHKMTDKCIQVKEQPDGLDFYYNTKSDANKLIAFLQSVVPIKTKTSKRLVSEDDKNNVKKYKFTLYVELSPVSKDDLVCLEPRLAQQLGGVCPIMLCFRVTQNLHCIDPLTQRLVDISAGTYWHHPFPPLMHAKQMIEYVVIAIERAAAADDTEVAIPIPAPNTDGDGLSKEDLDDENDLTPSLSSSSAAASGAATPNSALASAGSSATPFVSGPPSVAGSQFSRHSSAAAFAATATHGSASHRAAFRTSVGTVPAPTKSTVNPALINSMYSDLHTRDQQKYNNKHHAKFTAKLCLARCTVAKNSDFGVNDTQYECVTHLGHLLKEGDVVLGYQVDSAVISDALLYASDARSAVKTSKSKKKKQDIGKKDLQMPEVILVRKTYAKRNRNWKLAELPKDAPDKPISDLEAANRADDKELLMQDIETDPSMRSQVPLFKDGGARVVKSKSGATITVDEAKLKAAARMQLDEKSASAVTGVKKTASVPTSTAKAGTKKGRKIAAGGAPAAAAAAASAAAASGMDNENEDDGGGILPEDELIDEMSGMTMNTTAPPTPPGPTAAGARSSAAAASHLPVLSALPKAASPTGLPPQARTGAAAASSQQNELAAHRAREAALAGMTPDQKMAFVKKEAQREAEARAAAAFGGAASAKPTAPLAMSAAAAAAISSSTAASTATAAAASVGVHKVAVNPALIEQQRQQQQAMLAAAFKK